MKFTFKPRHNSHDNDCWCDAIALMTNQKYEEVYKIFKPLMHNDGSLSYSVAKGYLITKGYDVIDIDDLSLWDSLQLYNNKNGLLFLLDEKDAEVGHYIYVKNDVIYDNVLIEETLHFINRYTVFGVIIKLETR